MSCHPSPPAIVGLASQILAVDIALIATAITVVAIVPALADRFSSTDGFFLKKHQSKRARTFITMLAFSIPLFAASAISALLCIGASNEFAGWTSAALCVFGAALTLGPSVLMAWELKASDHAQPG